MAQVEGSIWLAAGFRLVCILALVGRLFNVRMK